MKNHEVITRIEAKINKCIEEYKLLSLKKFEIDDICRVVMPVVIRNPAAADVVAAPLLATSSKYAPASVIVMQHDDQSGDHRRDQTLHTKIHHLRK